MSQTESQLATSFAAKGQTTLAAHIGSRIRSRRLFLGIGLDLFAQAIGVPAQQVDDFECGAARASAAQLFKISDVLGKPIGFFFKQD